MPPPATAPNSPDEVETAFYEALRRADIEALMALWADDDDVVCVHPGGARAIGPQAIRASFEAIFASGNIAVQVQDVRRSQQINSALHHLVELVSVPGEGRVVAYAQVFASNWYLKTALGWRLVAHHASPGSPAAEVPAPAFAGTLH